MKRSVVLVNPPLQLQDRYGKDMKHFGGVSEPLGLAFIAGTLESRNVPVRILDAPAEALSLDDTVRDIASRDEAIVGITMLTPMFGVVKRLCERLREARPRVTIVLGGVHGTVLPERTLEEIPQADVVCIGEGEMTMAEFVEVEPGNWAGIAGICFRKDGVPTRTAKRPPVRDLDLIPPPARHLLPIKKYRLTASRVEKSDYCPTIIVARGCPFACTYCSHPLGRSFRTHSIERILSEIRDLIDQYGVSQLNIEADTLTANRKFLTSLCRGIVESGIGRRIKWTCESRIDTIDEEMLRLMKAAGCWQISYGVETGSQRLLDLINKSTTLEKIEEIFRITKRVGITIRGFFMLGLPSETRAESLATIAFAKKLDPLWAQFTITVPYPGTPMFKALDEAGQIRTYDWSKYNTWSGWIGDDDIPFVAEGRTIEELYGLQKQALRDFYLRPVVVWRFLRTMTSLYHVRKYAMGVWVLLKSRFS